MRLRFNQIALVVAVCGGASGAVAATSAQPPLTIEFPSAITGSCEVFDKTTLDM